MRMFASLNKNHFCRHHFIKSHKHIWGYKTSMSLSTSHPASDFNFRRLIAGWSRPPSIENSSACQIILFSRSRDKSLFALKSNKIACDSNIIPRHNQPIRIITFPINDRKRGKIRILCADDNNGFRNYNLFALWFWISVCGREVSEGKHNKKWGDYEASSRGCSCQNQIIVTCKFALAFHPPSSDVFLAVNRAGRVHQQHIQQAIITWQ